MKKSTLFAVTLLAVNALTISCNSDDNGNEPASEMVAENVLTIGDEEFVLDHGFLTDFGEEEPGVYDWDIDLFSDAFTIDVNTQNATGIGATVYIDLNTDSATGLVPGVYTYSETREPFTWVDAEAATNFNIENDSGTFFEAESGTVTITGTGADQLIEIDLIDFEGNVIRASYTGVLNPLED